MKKPCIPVGISNRHLHITQEHLETLFGFGYELTVLKELKQPGQFAAAETVTLEGPKGSFSGVRILGPVRQRTQVEISLSDSYKLGLKKMPIRDSGDLKRSPGLTIIGPIGRVVLQEGVIVAKRHIHMTPKDAHDFEVKDKDIVQVRVEQSDRKLLFDDVLVRVDDNFALELHLDMNEANACAAYNGICVELSK